MRAITDGTGLAKLRAEGKTANGKVAFFPLVVFDNKDQALCMSRKCMRSAANVPQNTWFE